VSNLNASRKNKLKNKPSYAFLTFLFLITCFMVMPFVFAISNSLKPMEEFFVYPPKIIVNNPTFDNFKNLFSIAANSWVPFSRYILNTVIITILGTTGNVMISSICAYAICKIRFPGSKLLFKVVVLSLMFSPMVTAIPNYLIISRLGFIDTYAAIIVPAFQSTLGLYLMTQFMESINDAILESARVEGANEFTIFIKIALPQVRPAFLTIIILSVQSLWNTSSSTFIYSEQLKTLPAAMSQIATAGIARAGVGAAASILMVSVPIITFVLAQKNIIQTMTSSGMKD
jgi:ABC-type glycerol-3-phosphate transport system permease component